ncbi:MAG: YqaA family protein [Pseudomonadota bacterium]
MLLPRLTHRLHAAAQSAQAQAILAVVAFLESSVFPLPAEVIMVPMCLAKSAKSMRYAAIATLASVLGGIFGWVIGQFLFDLIATPALNFWHSMPAFEALKAQTGTAMILVLLLTSGVAHLPPMKVVTILAGAIGFNLGLFILAAALARGGKFFLLGWALKRYGAPLAAVLAKRMAAVALVGLVVVIVILGVKMNV